MPMEAQTRLLRVLQQAEYTTVGGRTPIKTNVRIVAATNKDLRILIQQGLFREDLFFRLNVVPMRLPPLRERTEDIPDLARHFFAVAASEGLPLKHLDVAAQDRLKRYRWPGNIRELENLVRRLAALYPQEVIGGQLIEAELAGEAPLTSMGGEAAPSGGGRSAIAAADEGGLMGSVERHLSDVFSQHGDNLPPPGLYHRVLRELEIPLISGCSGGDTRQPDQGGRAARPQPQHLAQEGAGAGHPSDAGPALIVREAPLPGPSGRRDVPAPRLCRLSSAAAIGPAARLVRPCQRGIPVSRARQSRCGR